MRHKSDILIKESEIILNDHECLLCKSAFNM